MSRLKNSDLLLLVNIMCRGAIWKVKGYNGITLPDAVTKSTDFIKYNDAKAQFDEFTKKYLGFQHD